MTIDDSFVLTTKEQKKLDSINIKLKVGPLARIVTSQGSRAKLNSANSNSNFKTQLFHSDTKEKSHTVQSPQENQSSHTGVSSNRHLRLSAKETTLKKRLVVRLYSKPFQYTTVALSFLYIISALYAFGIDYVPETFHDHKIINISTSRWISALKLVLSTFFLIEVLLRVMVTGFYNYWRNMWNIFDFVVVALCLVLELMELVTRSEVIIRFDGYLMVFRLWYAFRTVQLLNTIELAKEEKLLKDATKRLNQVQTNMTDLRSVVVSMEEDLLEMSSLVDRINTSNFNYSNLNMIQNKSTWNRLVANQTPITIRTKIDKLTENDDPNDDYYKTIYSLNPQVPLTRTKLPLAQPKLIRTISKENLRRVKNHIIVKKAKFLKPKNQDTSHT